jgi:hypothetical protein
MNEDVIDRKLVCAFIGGLISDDREREKGLEYIRNMPPVNPTKTGWIPVSERLPKENEEVLVTTEWGEVTIGERYSTIDYFINDGAINANEDEIVAWIPLPKPYEPQERSGEE